MAKDLHITLTVNGSKLMDSFKAASSKLGAPDYGHDKYHNARLIGAYHAHKGAGPAFFASWKQTLSFSDGLFVQGYEKRGEWGQTNLLYGRKSISLNEAVEGVSLAFAGFGVAAQEAADRVASIFQSMGASVTSGIVLGVASSAQSNEYIVILERIKLRHWLERLYIPSFVACWVARHLPSWALPLMLYSWLKRYSNG